MKGLICPWCERLQKNNLTEHLLNRHGLVALGEVNKVTGYLRVRDFEVEQQNRLKQMKDAVIKLFDGDHDASTKWI
ncbi:MAG TPA: hypothetical protein VFD12_04440, partial [Oligella sp.]|nr:hypothetical protein [Oligella sp.]